MQSIVQLEIEVETTKLKIASGQDALQPKIHSETNAPSHWSFLFSHHAYATTAELHSALQPKIKMQKVNTNGRS